jgi:hypothetical protein
MKTNDSFKKRRTGNTKPISKLKGGGGKTWASSSGTSSRICYVPVSPLRRLLSFHYQISLERFYTWAGRYSLDLFPNDENTLPKCILWNLRAKSRDNAVGIQTSYGLNGKGFGVRVPVAVRFFSSRRRPDRFWGPLNLPFNGYWGLFPGGKAVGAWSWPLTSN